MSTPANTCAYLSVGEVARKLRVSEATVRRAVADGSLPSVQLRARGLVRIPETALSPPKETKP